MSRCHHHKKHQRLGTFVPNVWKPVFSCVELDHNGLQYLHPTDDFPPVWDTPPNVLIKSIVWGFYLIILHGENITNFEAVLTPRRSLHTKLLGCTHSHEHGKSAHPL